jgi:hypothetical protein
MNQDFDYSIHDLHFSINDIYEQLDEGRITAGEAREMAERCCLAFMQKK